MVQGSGPPSELERGVDAGATDTGPEGHCEPDASSPGGTWNEPGGDVPSRNPATLCTKFETLALADSIQEAITGGRARRKRSHPSRAVCVVQLHSGAAGASGRRWTPPLHVLAMLT